MFVSRKEFEKFKELTNANVRESNKNFKGIKDRLELLLKSVHGDDAMFGNQKEWAPFIGLIDGDLIIEKVKKGEEKHTQIYPKLK